MPTIDEQIREIEEEIRKTKYNKATEHHIGLLKAKLARLKEAKDSQRKGGGAQQGIKKTGNAMVSLVGFPSVGKSTLFNLLTNAKSEVGYYDFTTVNVIPGIMEYRGAKIQILDLPGLIEGASRGKGRGKEVLSVVRNSDLIMIVTDVNSPDPEPLIEILHEAGIRLNKRRPRLFLVKKDRGGLNIQKTVNVDLSDEMIASIMREFRIVNADLIIRDRIDMDDLIDFLSGNRVYIPGIFVLNKMDQGIDDKTNEIVDKYSMLKISAIRGEGIESLKESIFDALDFITIYLKPPDGDPEPMVIKRYSSIEMVCRSIHKDFVKNFKYAIVNGPSAKYPNQKVGLEHIVEDGDTVTIYLRRS
ncbi:MAG: OBG GTPase family GTP-binding protein [Thermoplasmata archaeon]|jgi:small GTP-binding protein|nr:GTP-binding protein [Thermoplasmatales archaeon]PMP75841.1 MAG: GTP-binding protein [Aciduliprofundum sp.]